MYEELQRTHVSTNFVKFARERLHPEIARVKLQLANNSKRHLQWGIKCTSDAIQALPKANGMIKAFDINECTLVWQRPKNNKSWRELPVLKMMLSIKLLSADTGKVVGEADKKFLGNIFGYST
ncbi:unnamed protein product [Gongylonema pulchrum]|uniref:DDE-1 domain-containing protein n=1 Tax=Gongylonema pulchrum TaxID=637853 RepID=A0A183DDA4_9BILA|nr:unnamed protein product [Gongylonema pulchrum]